MRMWYFLLTNTNYQMKYNIFILDDHEAIVRGLEAELKCSDFNIFSSSKLSDLKRILQIEPIDLLILDYELEECIAIDILPSIRKVYPNLSVIIYTMHTESWIISMLIKCGINGMVVKGDKIEELKIGVHKVLIDKERYYSVSALKTVLSIIGDQFSKRTLVYHPSPKELEVINLLSIGDTSEEISEKLFLSKNTIDTMRRNILLKSGAANVSHLMRIAFLNGWISA